MYINSNLSPREAFRIYGQLPEQIINRLIDHNEACEDIADCAANIREASSQFPEEDFLSETISDLQKIVKRIRGENKTDLQVAIDALEEIQLTFSRATEYGRKELNEALTVIEALED